MEHEQALKLISKIEARMTSPIVIKMVYFIGEGKKTFREIKEAMPGHRDYTLRDYIYYLRDLGILGSKNISEKGNEAAYYLTDHNATFKCMNDLGQYALKVQKYREGAKNVKRK